MALTALPSPNFTGAELADRVDSATSGVAALQATAYDAAAIFADTTAGLAGTAEGGYFRVPGTGDVAFTVYQKVGGLATQVAEIASAAAEGFRSGSERYRIVAGVLRQDTAGSGWYAIDDTGHVPLGISGVSVASEKITVTFDTTFGKVVSFIAAPDEALAKLGFTAGASVALDEARIELAAPLAFTVTFNGTTTPTVEAEDYWTITASVSSSSGALTVTHNQLLSEEVEPSVQMLDGSDFMGSVVQSTSRGAFTAYVAGPICTRVRHDGTAWTHDDPGMALTFFYNSTDGIAVQYGSDPSTDALWGAQVSQYGDGTYNPYIKAQAAGSTKIKFKNDAGTIQTAASTLMDCNLFVPGRFRRKVPSGKMYVERGMARVNPAALGATFLDQNTANIWFIGVFEVV